MASILGVFSPGTAKPEIEAIAAKMADVMRLNGEYEVRLWAEDGVCLGHVGWPREDRARRLLSDKDGKCQVVMEGDIYSVPESGDAAEPGGKVSDTCAAFARVCDDTRALGGVNGNFAFARYDREQRQLIIGIDRYGLRPLYWHRRGEALFFASEVKALLTVPAVPRTIDLEAVADFFTLGYILGDKTFFSDIRLLAPGSVLVARAGGFEKRVYWDFRYTYSGAKISETEAAGRISDAIRGATERACRGWSGRTGIFLSGGLDSRFIAAAVPRDCQGVTAMTYGSLRCQDVILGRRVAKMLGMKHVWFPIQQTQILDNARWVTWATDGMCNIVHAHAASAARSLSRHASRALLATSAEVLFGSHTFGLKPGMRAEKLAEISYALHRHISEVRCELGGLLNPVLYKKVSGATREAILQRVRLAESDVPDDVMDYVDLRERQRRFIFAALAPVDVSLDVAAPPYDNEVVDAAMALRPEWRRGERLYQRAFRLAYPGLARVPVTGSGFAVGAPDWLRRAIRYYRALARRVNHLLDIAGLDVYMPTLFHYANYGADMRNHLPLRNFIRDTLLDKKTLGRGYFQPAAVRKILDRHMSRAEDNAWLISLLLTFELFNRMFVDAAHPAKPEIPPRRGG